MGNQELEIKRSDLPTEFSVEQVIAQVQKIQEIQKKVMKEGEHYGVIPGTQKPTLLKPGAEKLNLVFRYDPQYESIDHYEGIHLTVKSKCTLWHIPTGLRMGSGEGSCSTHESKYAYRNAMPKCPTCGQETIIKGKPEFGGGWLCFKKKGGCGKTFKLGDASIEDQPTGKVLNEFVADQYNTILKMANKRSLIAAVLNVTAASDIFTQDIEDMPEETINKSVPPRSITLSTGMRQKLGDAILAHTNGDKNKAGKILYEYTGKLSPKDLTEAEAAEVMFKFEQDYLHPDAGMEG